MTSQNSNTLVRCSRCEKDKPPADFYRDKSRKNGLQHFCKKCAYQISRTWKKKHPGRTRSFQRAYYQRNREQLINDVEAYRTRNPNRETARVAIQKAIQDGSLCREPCFVCGGENTVDAHHEDYSKPYEIVWLCRICHKTYHRFMNDERTFSHAQD